MSVVIKDVGGRVSNEVDCDTLGPVPQSVCWRVPKVAELCQEPIIGPS